MEGSGEQGRAQQECGGPGTEGAGVPARPAPPGSSARGAASSPSHHMPAPAQAVLLSLRRSAAG